MTNEALTLVDALLAEQQRLTPVERFAQRRANAASPSRFYRDLLPTRGPRAGEQYAFSVDLDQCTGCKACAAACHNLNGLDPEETWRNVGQIYGGTSAAPAQLTITTSCHHCVAPACLEGCPVLAYEKDPRTGIVRHLDDQCIGCQYCIFKCPYDAPKYSPSRGIVRKCDLCASRLAADEAPACVQACPNEAIRITLVRTQEIVLAGREGQFLCGAPDPSYTLPATRYVTRRGLSSDRPAARASGGQTDSSASERADQIVCLTEALPKPEPVHLPLVVMLIFTQLSVGAFCVEGGLRAIYPRNLMNRLSPWHSLAAFVLGAAALAASVAHLGRPWRAWRSVIGLRRSWLSREIVVFSAFAALAMAQAAAPWASGLHFFNAPAIRAAVPSLGLLGVFCSLMVYRDTRRPFWSGRQTAVRFFGATAALGLAAILFLTTAQSLLAPAVAAHGAYHELTHSLAEALALISALKLVLESSFFRHLQARSASPARASAKLMAGELKEVTTARFLMGTIGGMVLPGAFLIRDPAPGWATLGLTIWLLVFVLLGELLERALFFRAVIAPRMPGMR